LTAALVVPAETAVGLAAEALLAVPDDDLAVLRVAPVAPAVVLVAEPLAVHRAAESHNDSAVLPDEFLLGVPGNRTADSNTRDNSTPDNTYRGSNTSACSANPDPNLCRPTPRTPTPVHSMVPHMLLRIAMPGYNSTSTMPQQPNQEFSS
jgi:hypothetical protein